MASQRKEGHSGLQWLQNGGKGVWAHGLNLHDRKARWQRHEVAGHIESGVRKLGALDAGAQLTFIYSFGPGHQIMGGC